MVLGFALFILQSGMWGSMPAMPTARQEVGVAAVEGRVFVVGGLDATGLGRPTLEIFDTRTFRWESGPPLPVSMHHPNVAAIGSRIYVAGGYAGPVGVPSATTFELDTDLMAWTQKADMPTPRGAGAAVSHNGRLFVFGGERGTTVTDVAAFDPVTNSWSTLAAMPTPRNHMGAAVVRGKIYVIGGRPGNQAVNEAYDPVTNTWTTRASMPTARSGHTLTSLNNFVFAFGGEGNAGSANGIFPQSEAYNPDLNSWTSLQPMATPRHGIGSGVVGGRIFIPGGAIVQGVGATSDSDFFAVQENLLIPQFVVGGGYTTSIIVTNPEQSRTAQVTLSLTGINGAPLETFLNGTLQSSISIGVPPLASRTISATDMALTLTPIKVGTAHLTADARISAYGLVRGVGTQLTVYPAAPSRNLIFNVSRVVATGINTGVAIANISTQPAQVTIRIHREGGDEVARVDRTLAAGEHLSRFIHQLFSELENADFTGTVTIRSSQQLAVAALAFDSSGVVTIPVTPIE